MHVSQPSKMPVPEPVELTLYGLLRVTRRGYLARLLIGLILALGLLTVRFWVRVPTVSEDFLEQSRLLAVSLWMLRNLHWIVLATVLFGGIEAFFVLRRFARLESAQRELLSESLPPH